MPHFAAGVVRFQNEVFPKKKELFEKLSQGQSPEALFITCSDSRIETAMIKLCLGDDVVVDIEEGEGIEVRVADHPDLDGSKNLAYRAAESFLAATGERKRIRIEITKRTPIAAGLGGGSSDAAATLLGLASRALP